MRIKHITRMKHINIFYVKIKFTGQKIPVAEIEVVDV